MSRAEGEDNGLKSLIGNLVVVGFAGSVLTRELRILIEEYHVGTVLLTSKNVQSAAQATGLITSIQACAHEANYSRPLLIALDQENGSIDSLVDPLISQFPSCMGIAASMTTNYAVEVAQATASELACTGVNWILGPVLDVLSDKRPSPLGVRAFGDDPIQVMKKGLDYVKGYKQAGLATCGKHFPSYGDVIFTDGSELSVPSMSVDLQRCGDRDLTPFRAAAQEGLDAILVGGCSLEMAGKIVPHACLDPHVVNGILREDWDFDGVILSECLAMEILCKDVGVSQGTSMAINAGCDMVLICQSALAQTEVLNGLLLAVRNGTVPMERILESNERVNALKDRCTSWQQALCPLGEAMLRDLRRNHETLSESAYMSSISLIRDLPKTLGRLSCLAQDAEVLLLTPLLDLFPSTATRGLSDHPSQRSIQSKLAPGENLFQGFGKTLAEKLGVRLTHMSYSSNGIRPTHEKRISKAATVIVMTADAMRNTYQYGVTKHVNMQCKYQAQSNGFQTDLVVVAVSSPYDFLTDDDIDTYICTYDFTPPSLNALAKILAGQFQPLGVPPLSIARRTRTLIPKATPESSHRVWLVESFDPESDCVALQRFFQQNPSSSQYADEFRDTHGHGSATEKRAFMVRNTSTKTIFGVLAVSINTSLAEARLETLLVDRDRRNTGIEESLRDHVSRYLSNERNIRSILGNSPTSATD